MFKDLLLPTTGTPGDEHALASAIGLAQALEAHLTVLETVSLPMFTVSPWGLTPDTLLTTLYAELRAKGEANVALLRQRLAKQSIAHEVRLADAKFVEPPRCVALHARFADLAVLAGMEPQPGYDSDVVDAMFNALLFESGRPVLVVPPRYALEWPLRRVAIAWRPTREASRAVHDALPLLLRAGRAQVVVVDPEVGERGFGEEPGADIATHLARHGLAVEVTTRRRPAGETVATALLRAAAEGEAQLLVAGGFGHSRLREWVLGGTTRELLRAMHLPVLFSH